MSESIDQLRYLRSDFRRWKCLVLKDYFYVFFEAGIWVTILYRLARAIVLIKAGKLSFVFKLLSFILSKLTGGLFGAAISPVATIGPGLYIGHTGGIRVSAKAIIGANFSFGPGCIIGAKGLGVSGAATIGDNVYVGTGAKILGPVRIGNGVRIGANAVVIDDIPEEVVAVGVPARVVKRTPKPLHV